MKTAATSQAALDRRAARFRDGRGGMPEANDKLTQLAHALDRVFARTIGGWIDSAAWYHPATGRCRVSIGDVVGEYDAFEEAAAAVVGRDKVEVCDECGPPAGPGWIRVVQDRGKSAGFGDVLRFAGRALKHPVGQTAAGGLAGLGLGAAELASGYAGSNMSPGAKATLLAANAFGGAMLGNPASRRVLVSGPAFREVEGSRGPVTAWQSFSPEFRPPGPEPFYRATRAFSPLRASATFGALAAAPAEINALDATNRVGKKIQDAYINHPERLKVVTDPSGYFKDLAQETATVAVDKATTSPAAVEGARSFGASLGSGIAGGVGGALLGRMAGGQLGGWLAPDDESLDYKSRRGRERMRGGLNLLGALAGGAGGTYLGQTYLAPRIADSIAKSGAVAKGIPRRDDPGDHTKLREGELVDYSVQEHLARRSGRHLDVRLGTPDVGLISWATKKELPEAGKTTAWHRQPVHRHSYLKFQGTIPGTGYGAGVVRRQDLGEALVTRSSPHKLEYTTAHRREPSRFDLTNIGPVTWLAKNTTPTEPVPYEKVHYRSVPPADLPKLLETLPAGSVAQPKVDGASMLLKLMKRGPELMSYRASAEGRPIVYTEKLHGCFTEDAPVIMADGSVKLFGRVRQGDRVRTPDGAATVVRVWDNGWTDAWVAVDAGGQSVTTTPNHEFFVVGLGWVPIGMLETVDAVVQRDGRIRVDAAQLPDLRQAVRGQAEAPEYGDVWSPLRRCTDAPAVAASGLYKTRAATAVRDSERVLEPMAGGELAEALGPRLAQGRIRGSRAFVDRDGGRSRLFPRGDAAGREAGEVETQGDAAALARETYRTAMSDVEGWQAAREDNRGRSPGPRDEIIAGATHPDAGSELSVVRPGWPDRNTPYHPVCVLEGAQGRQHLAALLAVSRPGGQGVRGTGEAVLRVRRLPGAPHRRLDLEVDHPACWYVVGGFVVHNSRPPASYPKSLIGTVLKGELYGVQGASPPGDHQGGVQGGSDPTPLPLGHSDPGRSGPGGDATDRPDGAGLAGGTATGGRVIAPQRLGGLLNATLANSLRAQRRQGVSLKAMLYDIQQHGRDAIDLHTTPYAGRRRLLEDVARHLPAGTFHVAPQAEGREAIAKLWDQVSSGTHPLTSEGIVVHPPTGKPVKVKQHEDRDVVVTGTYPGEGRRGATVGGLTYAHPDDPTRTVGRVGSGFDDATLRAIAADPASYIGRTARLRAQEEHDGSRALRGPRFLAWHEG